MNRSARTIIVAVIGMLGLSATSAMAETAWERNHPRRDQVNDRLENQDRRINHEYHEGELTPGQAWRLHREDHTIRQEERAMASFNHGHITGAEERALNQQENVAADGSAADRRRAAGPARSIGEMTRRSIDLLAAAAGMP